ncbi:MAG: bifunctional phosphoglucose/phosphomannose isomerase [Candidatus Thorarchaeota archaeon]|nr:bifunctional phosphoglucose/phosphomannose isomerase [Candidatus Thorarchaeota archaeon]
MTLPSTIKLDNMRNMVTHFPQLLSSIELDSNLTKICKEYEEEGIVGICFIGMGGSSIAGSYTKAILQSSSEIPMMVVKDYVLPKCVGRNWIVIAVSYSGNTEETLSALDNATASGARRILITSGGEMSERKNETIIQLPGGLQPRAALPLILSAVLPVTEKLLNLVTTDLQTISSFLVKSSDEWGKWIELPIEIIKSISNSIPLFMGAEHLIPVAYRAKCQINENSKSVAFYSELPEANHNEIEGFANKYRTSVLPILLRSTQYHPRIAKRFDVTKSVYENMGLRTIEIFAKGDSAIQEMLSLTHYLDSVSVELADINGTDSLMVEKISELKKRL